MNFCLLTSFHTNHTRSSFIHRLVEEGEKQGVILNLINPAQVTLKTDNGQTEVLYQGKPFPRYNLIHYALRWDDEHTWNIVAALQELGYYTVPTQRMPLGDHITMARLFARQGIKTPRTWVMPKASEVQVILPELTFPCMFRVRRGQKGRSVFKVNNPDEALALAGQLQRAGVGVVVCQLMQPLGEDVRAVVVGGQVVAAVHRKAANDYLRPAEDNNALVTATTLTAEETKLCLNAAKLYHAPYAAVNFLRSAIGPVLFEVARAPVLTETERTTGVNIAQQIIAHLLQLAQKAGK